MLELHPEEVFKFTQDRFIIAKQTDQYYGGLWSDIDTNKSRYALLNVEVAKRKKK